MDPIRPGNLLFLLPGRWVRKECLRVSINEDVQLFETQQECIFGRAADVVATLPSNSVACLDAEVGG